MRCIATDVSPRKVKRFTNEMDQKESGFHFLCSFLSVDCNFDLNHGARLTSVVMLNLPERVSLPAPLAGSLQGQT